MLRLFMLVFKPLDDDEVGDDDDNDAQTFNTHEPLGIQSVITPWAEMTQSGMLYRSEGKEP